MLASDVAGTARPGLAFNQRGLPCQRLVAGGNCTNSIVGAGLPPQVAWVTYFQYALRNGGGAFAAAFVTSAGGIQKLVGPNEREGGRALGLREVSQTTARR